MTRTYRITLLPGDGIGPEITRVAVAVLETVGRQLEVSFEFTEALIGGSAIDATGEPLPEETLTACRASDAIMLAAIGGYKWDTLPSEIRPERGLLGLRSGLGLFANLRPAQILPQLIEASTLQRDVVEGVDIMVVRELTGGIYFGEPSGIFETESGARRGVSTMVYGEDEIDRIAQVAFKTAQQRQGRLCSVDKANVLAVSRLWREKLTTMGEQYTDVELSHMYVDNAAMQLVRSPKQFDTIVTGNLFGDVLSDVAAMLTGSIGMLPSASLGAPGEPGVFEPVHGSAPDIAGQDLANPLAQVLSAAMMCRYGLELPEVSDRIEAAVNTVLNQGYRTGDIMAEGMTQVGCQAMGDALLKALESSAE